MTWHDGKIYIIAFEHQFSARYYQGTLNAFRITGPFKGNPMSTSGFLLQRASNPASFDVSLVVEINILLNKRLSCRWFETHIYVYIYVNVKTSLICLEIKTTRVGGGRDIIRYIVKSTWNHNKVVYACAHLHSVQCNRKQNNQGIANIAKRILKIIYIEKQMAKNVFKYLRDCKFPWHERHLSLSIYIHIYIYIVHPRQFTTAWKLSIHSFQDYFVHN